MDYKSTIDFLFQQLPMYQRIGAAAYKKDLSNTIALCNYLGNPQQKFKSIHIAGTNGKGSVSHILSAILSHSGYKTGLYTSPHLLDFRERIRINGTEVSEEFVIDFVEKIAPAIHEIKPSFFEITVVMAFEYFASQNVDFAVIETGLGGRLDSTNVITPMASIITNISLEHENMLGDTIEKIAYEKAGIIKGEVPVVIGKRNRESDKVFDEIAVQKKAPIFYMEDYFDAKFKNIEKNLSVFEIENTKSGQLYNCKCDLLGDYQGENIAICINAIEVLKEFDVLEINDNYLESCQNVRIGTGLRGRWEKMNDQPLVICDISHNPEAIKIMLRQLDYVSFNHLKFVFGMSNDKNFDQIFSLLPTTAEYFFAKPNVPRGLDANELKNKASKFQLLGEQYESVENAIIQVMKKADPNDLVLIGGSAFVVAEALEYFKTNILF